MAGGKEDAVSLMLATELEVDSVGDDVPEVGGAEDLFRRWNIVPIVVDELINCWLTISGRTESVDAPLCL